MSNIIIYSPYQEKVQESVISLEQYYKKRRLRKKRLSRRLFKRFPLFAAEFVAEEFKGFEIEDLDEQLKGMKKSKKFKGKSQVKQMGRYQLLQKALSDYYLTGEMNKLYEAQRLRNNMFKPYKVLFNIENGGTIEQTFPPQTAYQLVVDCSKIKYSTEKELIEKLNELLRYAHTF
jgi:hypothetical protein